MANGLGLGLHLDPPETEILGSLETPQQIDTLQFKEGYPYPNSDETLAIWLWRREGPIWGIVEEHLTFQILKKCLQRCYLTHIRSDHHEPDFLTELQETIEADLFSEDNILYASLQVPVRRLRIQCHHGITLQDVHNKLFLRRRMYPEGIYHCTMIFQMKPGDKNNFIAVEVLLRRSNDDMLPLGLDRVERKICKD